MALTSSDGKPYRTFSEPNPIAKDQVILSKDQFSFNNFKWTPIIVEAKKKPVSPPKKKPETMPPMPQSKEDFMDLLKKEAATLKKEKPKSADLMEGDGVLIVHCHPAVVREHIDEFYGETRTSVQYGAKTEFEAIIVDCDDIEISLFTQTSTLTKGSILFPSKYKSGEPLEMFRWWKIVKTQAVKNGFLILGEITEHNRDFSN